MICPMTLKIRGWVVKKKRKFDYEGSDQPIPSPRSRYETDYFNTMVDSIITNMNSKGEGYDMI